MGERQGSNVIFFLQICKEVPGEKKRGGPVAPPTGDRPLSPIPGATSSLQAPGGAVAPPAGDRGGPVAPPTGDRVSPPYIRPPPHSLLSFDLKKSKKIQKKERGEKKGSGEALPNSALVIYR